MKSLCIGRIRKTDNAEVRVSRNTWKGRPVVDVRVWFRPDGSAEYVPSRKGLTIDAAKVGDLVDLLGEAA